MKASFLAGLIIVSIIILATCSPAPQASDQVSQSQLDARATQIMLTLMAPPPGFNPTPQVSTPAGAASDQPVAASTPAVQPTPNVQLTPLAAPAGSATAMNNTDQLNLREGPGFSYKIAKTLPRGEVMTVLGRSSDGDWIEVHLQDGSGGWVFSSYLLTSANLSALPVSQASGGPVSQPVAPVVPAVPAAPAAAASPFAISVTIAANQAQAAISKFPASKPISATLSTTGGGETVVVAGGQTDASGAASLNFAMPFNWPDGTPVNQTSLVLTVSTSDGAFSRRATISFISGR